jgi:hypothetical protein
MATRIRTLNFLPEIFKTTTNSQFLQATLDQLVAQPSTKRIEGYIGSTFGYGVNANDKYVTEPTKTRTDYQLDPGVVFLKENDTTANDFISYPGIIDALKLEGAITEDNDRLFTSQFYSWDSFTDLDKIINFNQYYWLPEGPGRVLIASDIVYNLVNFTVVDEPTDYLIYSDINPVGTPNPTLTLLRGGTYTFTVNQDTQFWIQGNPGVTGYSITQPNVQTRDVFGVTNNGANAGTVTFTVPEKNALNEYNFPVGPTVGVVSTIPYSQLNGATISSIGNIDGVTALDGLTVMFYNTSEDVVENAQFYEILVGPSGIIELIPAGLIPTNQSIVPLYGTEYINRGFYRNVNGYIDLIPYNSAILDQLYYQDGTSSTKVGVIRLVDSNVTNEINVLTEILGKKNYTAPNGVVFTNGLKILFQGNVFPNSYDNVEYYVEGVGHAIELIAVDSLVSPGLFSEGTFIPFDTTPFDVGNYDSGLYIPVQQDYITIARNAINRNAWSRSNRWFHIDVINATATYNNDSTLVTDWATTANKAKRPIIEFYPNLRLYESGVLGKDPIDFIDTRTSDAFTIVAGQESYYPDVAGYSAYTATITPVPGTITTKTVSSTASLTNLITLNTTAGLYINDTITFDADIGGLLQYVPGSLLVPQVYYITEISGSNIQVSLQKQGTPVALTTATGPVGTIIYPHSTIVTVPTTDLDGLYEVGQYIIDSTGVLPAVAFITNISIVSSNTIITVEWDTFQIIQSATNASVVTADTPLSNYALFDGARIVFAADTNVDVRNKIYVARFSSIELNSTPIITLTEAPRGDVLPDEQTAVYRGYYNQGKDFYFDGIDWFAGQQKTTVNQAPYFDIFDNNGVSLGDDVVYVGTSFAGTTLFSYGIGTGSDDSILGFPLRYSSVDNVGDISFDITLNSQTFDYVNGTVPKTEQVNIGYVYNYTDRLNFVRELGWQTAVSPSIQYQIFEFDWSPTTQQSIFNCDIAPVSTSSTNWPVVQVYINNRYQDPATAYTYTTTDTTTSVSLTVNSLIDTVVQVLILSDQVSSTAYYEIPINLSNNPFNEDVTTVNVGDIRGQYQSIFYNNPNTTGETFGPNNYRDLGNMVPWGNRIIQNSSSMALPGAFLRKQSHNLFNSLLFNSRQYITFKTLLVDTVNGASYTTMLSPATMLDLAMDQITASKTDSEPFFWSDMLPAKSAYISNTYSFANSLDISIYPLSRVYNFDTANYYGVLVYLLRNGVTTQLIKGVDYTVSTTAPSLTVTTDLLPNDQITINEYNQTYGNYVPNTPTKLGLYPATIPNVTLDTSYIEPTYFIVGHDGSFNKLYGDYDSETGALNDFRDQVLLEYETRVYNNLKLSNVIPIQLAEIIPGFFRTTDYTYTEFLQIYSEAFLNWAGENRINYKKQLFNQNNQFTYNYDTNGTKVNGSAIEQGYFRGLYLFYYDTSTPNTTPWEMIGYADQPSWWTSRYGAAPYTSDNLVLWDDLAQGIDWNDGNPVIIPKYIRAELLEVLPVDSNGNLLSPFDAIMGNYNTRTFNRDWKVGDVGPAEFSYRRSSTWAFDLMRILALTRPAAFYNLAVDVDNYKYNAEFNQFLVNDRSHLRINDVLIYGSGTPATSYINWIVDYEKQVGVDATTNITTLLDNLDVRLVYRVAGFSDKDLLQFYVEKSSANSNNSSLLIPDESYQVLLYDNQPFDRIIYSGVVIQISENGYKVFGNSQTEAYFTILAPKDNAITETVTVENLTVKLATGFYDRKVLVPYGTEFYSVQEVAQFLNCYGKYLETQGMVFEQIENAIPVNWQQMVAEYMYWAQMGWELGSITTINPAATLLSINRDSYIVQPLTLRQQNFVLNQNLYPIQSIDLSVVREGTVFTAQPLNQGDAISYGQFNISNFEHGIVFSNVTLFNDILYNLITGLRQNRIFVRGAKTAEWNGTVDAFGFILNQDNIQQWNSELKYTKGEIVLYKNRYWSALTIVQAKQVFDEMDWKEVPYDQIQKGLLPNSQTRSYESALYYNSDNANLEQDADLLSFSLIGYRPRDYLATANLTDITQVNVYKNMIKEKGTLNAAKAFKGANLSLSGIDYDIYENWAIKSGEYGGVLNNNFIEVRLQESVLTGNPSIVGLTNGVYTDGVQQEIPLYSIFNYGRPVNSPDILPTISSTQPSTLLPTAGYVNYNDVKMSSYFYSGLANARNAANVRVPINQFYVRDYVWLANYLADWQVYTPVSLGSITNAKNNLNGTVTITFSQAHNLTRYQLFAILNFNSQINNYYIVAGIVDPFRVIINLSLAPTITNLTGQGVGFRMQSQRVLTAPEVADLPSLLDNEFNKLKVWVDTNNDGSWAVFRKSLNYQYDKEILRTDSQSFGSAVAYTPNMGYLIGDADAGVVYRYRYDDITSSYLVDQTVLPVVTAGSFVAGQIYKILTVGTTNFTLIGASSNTVGLEFTATGVGTGTGTAEHVAATSFGSTITYVDDLFVISEPTGTPYVYVYQLIATTLEDNVNLYQIISAPGGITNWGSATAMSGDQNWLYISDILNNSVHVYRKSELTGLYVASYIIDGDALSLTSAGDQFGYSISTDYYGDTVVVGTPYQNYDINTENYGYTYVFARTVQNFEEQAPGQSYAPRSYNLTWTPTTVTQTATATATATERITVTSSAGFSVGDPVVFSGTTLLSAGAIAANTVYYVYDKPTGTTFRIATTRDALAPIDLVTSSGSMTCTIQTTPLTVNINGTALADNYYAVIGSTLSIYSGQIPTVNAGDIVNVSGSNFVLTQTLTNEEPPRIGVQFGTSVDTNQFANEILVGAPFELSDKNQEGAVHRFTNGGEKYGIIIGTQDCNITAARTILLNGYAVTLPIGNATTASTAINAANITNVTASTIGGKLVIQLVDVALSVPSNKLSLTVLNSATLSEMGVSLYIQTQKILCPHVDGPTQFGTVVKFNEQGSFVASAPTGARYTATTFDFTDDELDNDTVFDNNATQWRDTFTNAGAVYMFDYLSAYSESVNNPGKFVYAQSTNAQNLDYGSQPMYGQAIDFNNNHVIIGTPNFNPTTNAEDTNGQVISYISLSSEPDWAVYRSSAPVVDINSIGPIQLFSASTNNTLENLDYFDPLQGKLLGAVQENIDVISNTDPAGYNSPGNTQRGIVWGASQVGEIWFNTTNSRFVNYHQNDVSYNSQYWGRVFTGSDVAVYSWIVSDVPPTQYAGPGTPFNINTYAIHAILNTDGAVVPVYYYWVRNTNVVFDRRGKTLADSTIQSYIAQPQNAGISYFAPLQSDIFALYNTAEFVNANDTVLHIGYATGTNDDVSHEQFSLIRDGYADDFLDGLPGSGAAYQSIGSPTIEQPIGLYNRMLDSLSGVDNSGAVVPNPFLPKAVQSGVLARPRQSFFYNRFGALKNYLKYANAIMAQFPIVEIRNPQFLYRVGEINPSTINNTNWSGATLPFFDTTKYWNLINWWAPGYNDNTRATLQVPIYADLATLVVDAGTIVTVATNGAGNAETYRYNSDGTWTRIGLANGTIEFSSYLWDYSAARLGFGDNFFDTTPYDEYPSEETRYIVRALNEEIYTNELLVYRNKSLILLFEYIQSETIESQNFLPWLNKTSLIDVSHTIRELRPIEVFQSDYQDFLSGYLNEVKPFHVVIKEFLFKYTGTDVFEGDITDFDLPAQYSTTTQTFVSPELVYSNPNNTTDFSPANAIWQTPPYSQWFNNYGLSIVGQPNYPISILASYVALNSGSLIVDNASGFPVTGVILIDEELISYNQINLANNELSGLSRGISGTLIQAHIPGSQIIIDLPAALVLNSGRGYANPPLITASIDTTIYPAPRVPAQFEAVMSLDKVISITVINPGEGYAVLPTISIEPSLIVNIPSNSVNLLNNTLELTSSTLQSGDLVVYNPSTGSTQIGGLDVGQNYYIGLLESTPSPIIALYSTYGDAIYDRDRILLTSTGTGTQTFSLGAYASCITSSAPVRENNITLRFDRTSYTSQVIDWVPSGFYGSFYAGNYTDETLFSSSAVRLYSTTPPIGGTLVGEPFAILASAQGGAFQILDVENQQTLTWSSRTRDTVQTYGPATLYPNTIRINPSEGGAPVSGEIGSTIGFYLGMPVKFVGAVPAGSNLVNDQTYYVESLVQLPDLTSVTSPNLVVGYDYVITSLGTTDWNTVANTTGLVYTVNDVILVKSIASGTGTAAILEATGFTITSEVFANGDPDPFYLVTLGTTTVPQAGLPLFVGNLTNKAILTINYNGLRNTSATSATNNTVTVDLTVTGQAGTTLFYTGLPIFFVGTEFGGIIENKVYYVNAIIDKNTFTMTAVSDPTIINCAGIIGASDEVLCSSTLDLTVNDPVIFNNMGINGTAVLDFGGIENGVVYYIKEIVSGTSFTLSATIGGSVVPLTTVTPSLSGAPLTIAPMLLQTETVPLTTATGSMLMNINYAISPGQINGQQFTLYGQTIPYPGVSGTTTNLLDRLITATLPDYDRICLATIGGGITNIYDNMMFNVSEDIGGLVTGTNYTVTNTGTTSINISETEAIDDWLVLTPTVEYTDTIDSLYVGMPLYFTEESLGGVLLNTEYYVHTIDTGASKIKISEDVSLGTVYAVTNQAGAMIGTGESYVEIAPGNITTLETSTTINLVQHVGTDAEFVVEGMLGGYAYAVTVLGTSYAVNNIITILGTDLGGTSPANDLTLTVMTVGNTGGILTAIAAGTPNAPENDYYFKVINQTQVEVYIDPNFKVAVSGQDFPYIGVTTTTATSTDSGTDRITVTSSAEFVVNDPIVFTGEVFGDIVLGQTYYILSKPTSTTVTITETAGGAIVPLTTDTGTMTMARAGDYALLPQPFYFNPSIVKYGNNVYQCIISNNDLQFIVGKWELLQSGSRKLNALDRIDGYYKPDKSDTEAWNQYINMPGKDLTQLVSGITYPNSTYLGNPFPPAEEYVLDTILSNQPFYPIGINLTGVTWDGVFYSAVSDASDYSSVNVSTDSVDWALRKLSNSPLGVTDIVYANGNYVITTTNSATPILVSTDRVAWDSTITYVPLSASNTLPLPLNGITYYDGLYVAVGDNIITSRNLNTWTQTFAFIDNGLVNTFNAATYVSTSGILGIVAVGTGQRFIAGQATNTGIVYRGTLNGDSWTDMQFNVGSTSGLNSIAANGQTMVVVGEDGVIYTSFNGINWYLQTSSVIENLNSVIWDSVNSIFVAVGDSGTILTSDTSGGIWTDYTNPAVTTDDLESIVYNNDSTEYVIVGLNSTIVRSSDAITWTSSSVFETTPTVYNVEGDPFTVGYGPEELVPGVVTDALTMITATRPGTNWDETIYQHVGYKVVSLELTPSTGSQTEYSFANAVSTPAQITVFVINYSTGLSTTIVGPNTDGIDADYSIDWVNKIVILNNPLTYISAGTSDKLRIDVYETGNGDQLVKANTETDPIRQNAVTGFQEIYVNANYTASIYQGSGVIRPTTEPQEVTAISTSSITNAITCVNVEDFVLNSAITFSGAVFGNIVEDQVYYVKSISYVSNRITISEFYNITTGTAGATFTLSTATGSMEAIIQVGTGAVWTPPSVFHNGAKMVLGHTATATRTKSVTDTVTAITTGDLVVNQSIKFSNTIFGGIVPLQTYYIKEIIDANEFTISATVDEFGVAGPVFELENATGGAIFVSADYAISLADNGISASLILANEYNTTEDYITYTLFGETLPVQYGYTIPEVQSFAGTGSASEFTLTNYIGDSNVTNAIVEIDGVRQTSSAYTINPNANSIIFNTPPVDGSVISITSYNLTDRQYFNTAYGITGGASALTTITVSDTVNSVVPFDSGVLAGSFVIGQLYTIQSLYNPYTIAGSFIVGASYTILTVGTTNFTLIGASSNTAGVTFTATGVGSGTGTAEGSNTDFTLIGASSNTVGVTFTATGSGTGTGSAIIAGTGYDATLETGLQTAGSFVLTNVYSIVTLGTTTNTEWNTIAGTSAITYSVGSTFTCANIGTGLGNGTAYAYSSGSFDQELNYLTLGSGTTSTLELNYPIVFSSPTLGGIIAGQTYYVVEIINSTDFVISTTVEGAATVVTTDSGSMDGIVNGLTVANIVNIDNNIQQPQGVAICSETVAAPSNYIICGNTSSLLEDQPIIFKAPIFEAGSFTSGLLYQITTLGSTDWNAIGYIGTPEVGGTFNCDSNPQTGDGEALLASVGGVDTTGTYYFIDSIVSITEFTIKDQYGTVITLTDSTENMVGFMGGNVAVRVETGINHQLTENALVRLDGILGSVQLNNNIYYAKIITDTQFYLYQEPYEPALSATNDPVTFASTYISGGYVWLDQLFTVADTYTISTTAANNRISVGSASTLIPGTPVYFTKSGATVGENILGNIEANTEYYVLEVQPTIGVTEFILGNTYEIATLGTTTNTQWNDIADTAGVTYVAGDIITCVNVGVGDGTAIALQEFTITAQRYPNESEFVLTDATGVISVSQFQQVNVDRLWVTIDGYRVPSSSLRLNEYNNLSILSTITTGAEVIITSMMPTATPNEEVYLLNVSTTNQGSVYRANTQTRTWLVHPLSITDATVYVNDATRITDTIVQTAITPSVAGGKYSVGLTANKNAICKIVVYNNDTSAVIDSANYSLSTFDIAPVILITPGSWIATGDSLTITITEGRLIYVNGEQIGFNSYNPVINVTTIVADQLYTIQSIGNTDFVAVGASSNTVGLTFTATGSGTGTGTVVALNALSGLTRGANGTGAQVYIPLYSEVFGIISSNRMSDVLYATTWNPIPGLYNTIDGDPLQISQTTGANFLRVDIN